MIPPNPEFAASSQQLVEQLLSLLKGVPESEAEQCLREALRGLQPASGAHFAVDEGRAEIEALVRRETMLPSPRGARQAAVTVAGAPDASDASDDVILGSDVGTGLGSDPLRRALFQLFKDVPAHKLRAIELWLCLQAQAQARAELQSEVRVEPNPSAGAPPALGATTGGGRPRTAAARPNAVPENWAQALSQERRRNRRTNLVRVLGAALLGGSLVWMYSAEREAAVSAAALEPRPRAPVASQTQPPLPRVPSVFPERGTETSSKPTRSASASAAVLAPSPQHPEEVSPGLAAQPGTAPEASAQPERAVTLTTRAAPSLTSPSLRRPAVAAHGTSEREAERLGSSEAESAPPRSDTEDVFGSRE